MLLATSLHHHLLYPLHIVQADISSRWGLIFPLGTTTTTFASLSINLNSSTFRVLAAIFTIFLTIMYIMNWGLTIWHCIYGEYLIKPNEEEIYEDEKID